MNFIVMSHGPMAEGIVGSAEMIVGQQDNVQVISVTNDSTLSGTQEKIEKVYRDSDNEDTFIVCDILGGTPSNASMRFMVGKDNVRMVTGMNLPMMLELFMANGSPLEDLVEVAKKSYDKGFNIFSRKDVESNEESEEFTL